MAAEDAAELMQMQRPGDKGFALLHKDLKTLRKQLGEGGIRHGFGEWALASRMRGEPVSTTTWKALLQQMMDYTRFRPRTKPWTDGEKRVIDAMKKEKKSEVDIASALDRAWGHEYAPGTVRRGQSSR